MRLSQLGEFGLIDRIKQEFASLPAGANEGIGDDCAILPINAEESFVVTTDMLVEGVHFLRHTTTPYLLGKKSLSVNLSDVAAMGARPIASFLSIALPAETDAEWIEEFMKGYLARSTEFSVPLLGGDTTSSTGMISINVTALGRIRNQNIKRRGDGKPGDKIFVTGYLGGSSQGLLDLGNGVRSPFYEEHNDPKPAVFEGIWLGEQTGVHAMIDLSDGIASDLRHILRASSLGAKLFVELIPTNTSVKMAVTGGEDYKLLCSIDADAAPTIAAEYERKFGAPLYEIGELIDSTPEIHWMERGQKVVPDWKGFTHF